MTGAIDWRVVLFLAGLIAVWSLIIIATLRWMLSRHFSQYDKQFQTQSEANQTQGKANQKLKEKFLELKADLPLSYVRKEDFIRHEVVINTKLDRLRDLIEDMKEKKA